MLFSISSAQKNEQDREKNNLNDNLFSHIIGIGHP